MASVSDANAFTILFPSDSDDKPHVFKYYFWMPNDTVQRKSEIASYPDWVKDGHIVTTPGRIIDQKRIVSDILELCKTYNIKAIGFDPYMAYHGVVQELIDNEIEMVEIRQTRANLSTPTKTMAKMVKGKTMNHAGNPVMRWMIGNVMIVLDGDDNVKIDKKKSSEKVDGPVSMVMAIATHLGDDGESGESRLDAAQSQNSAAHSPYPPVHHEFGALAGDRL